MKNVIYHSDGDYYTSKSENGNCSIDGNIDLDGKLDVLVSGKNIKTINNESILGEGNLEIEGIANVEDNLSSHSVNNALSANKGRELKESITKLDQKTNSFATKEELKKAETDAFQTYASKSNLNLAVERVGILETLNTQLNKAITALETKTSEIDIKIGNIDAELTKILEG